MADAGLRGADGNFWSARAGPTIDGSGLGAVVQWRAGSVRVQVADLPWNHARALAGSGHGGECSVSLRMGLGQMVRVRGGAVAGNFAENVGAPALRVFQGFQRQHRRAFAESKPVAPRIERAAAGG